MQWSPIVLMVAMTLGAEQQLPGQAPLPELRFADPPGFYRSASYPPADFSSTVTNASLQVYPFRQVTGDIRQAFSRTMLRELIDPRYQESLVAPGPRLDAATMPGADIVLRARFKDFVGGQYHERMRMVVVVGNSVAILDASATSMVGWQQILPQLNAFHATVQVTSSASQTTTVAPPTSGGPAVAGLYQGFLNKFDAIRNQSIYAAYYYLLSADGRAYRHYDELSVPGNDPSRFDFAGAQRADAMNSGRWVLQNGAIVMRFGTSETLVARMVSGNTLVIANVRYERQ